MKTVKLWAISVIFALLGSISMTSCEKEPLDVDIPTDSPIETPVMMGWFSINSGSIVTNEDGKNKDAIDDFVYESALPNVDFELMGIHAFIPSGSGYSVTVKSVRVEMNTENYNSTGNIFNADLSDYVQNQIIDGKEYAVFKLFGMYNGGIGSITPSNFANVVWTFTVDYKMDGSVVDTRDIYLSVYKR